MASRVIPFPKRGELPIDQALALVARLRDGDERACLELVAHYAHQIRAYPTKCAGGAREWTDAMLDDWWGYVSPRLCGKFRTYRAEGGAPLGGWLATALFSLRTDWFKKKTREREAGARLVAHVATGVAPTHVDPSVETDRERAERNELIRSVFAGLRADRRICFALPEHPHWLTDADLDELARRNGLDAEAARRKIHEVCTAAQSDLDIVDLLYPPTNDQERSAAGRRARQNAIQKNRSRAKQDLKRALEELAR